MTDAQTHRPCTRTCCIRTPPRTLPHLLPRLALPTRTETAPASAEENQGQRMTDTACEHCGEPIPAHRPPKGRTR